MSPLIKKKSGEPVDQTFEPHDLYSLVRVQLSWVENSDFRHETYMFLHVFVYGALFSDSDDKR